MVPRWSRWWALGRGDSLDECWEIRGKELQESHGPGCPGSLEDGWSQAAKGHVLYLHDADVVGTVQFALLDHFLLERGKVPLQVLSLAGVLLLQVCVQPCNLHLVMLGTGSAKEGRCEAQSQPVQPGKGGTPRAHHVCPLHVLLEETADLIFQLPWLLNVCYTVVKVCLKATDQGFQVPLL